MATAYFLELITGMSDVEADQEHIPIVLESNPQTPDRTAYILDHTSPDPLPELIRAGEDLKRAGAEYIAIPCVTAHYFYDELCRATGLAIIPLLERTAAYFARHQIRRVAIMATSGTVKCGLLQRRFSEHGIEAVLPDEDDQKKIMDIIYGQIKAGQRPDIEEFREIGNRLIGAGAGKLLLGCTELSLLKRDFPLTADYVDILEILAAEAITVNGLRVKEYKRDY